MINGIGKHVAFGDWFIFRSEVCAPQAPQVVGRVSTSSLFMAGESPSVWTHRAWLTPPPADIGAAPPGSRCARARASVFGHPFSALSGLDLGAGSLGVARPTTVPLDAPRTVQSASPSGRGISRSCQQRVGAPRSPRAGQDLLSIVLFRLFCFSFPARLVGVK